VNFVRCTHPDVEAEAVLPVSALRLLPGWDPVEPAEVVDTAQTVPQVLAEVGDDPVKAAAALEAEQATNKPRKSLVEGLSSITAPHKEN
jgi:hypothetical protein